jgi:hypothetical protein
VWVEAFLDSDGNTQDAYDSNKTTSVRVSFAVAKLDGIVASLAAAEQIWIENEPGCK